MNVNGMVTISIRYIISSSDEYSEDESLGLLNICNLFNFRLKENDFFTSKGYFQNSSKIIFDTKNTMADLTRRFDSHRTEFLYLYLTLCLSL